MSLKNTIETIIDSRRLIYLVLAFLWTGLFFYLYFSNNLHPTNIFLNSILVEIASIAFVIVVIDYFLQQARKEDFKKINEKNYKDLRNYLGLLTWSLILDAIPQTRQIDLNKDGNSSFTAGADKYKQEPYIPIFIEAYKICVEEKILNNKAETLLSNLEDQRTSINGILSKFYPYPNPEVMLRLENLYTDLKIFLDVKVAVLESSNEQGDIQKKAVTELLLKKSLKEDTTIENYYRFLIELEKEENLYTGV